MKLDAAKIERVFGIPARNWRARLEANLANGQRPVGTSLAIAGYPELHLLSFYLTEEAAARWKAKRELEYPPPDADPVLIQDGVWEERAPYLTLIGRNPETLAALREQNNRGDITPPWRLFPEHDSYSGFWRQSGEHWMSQVFRPFWSGLSGAQKSAYLDRWPAPEEWVEFLSLLARG